MIKKGKYFVTGGYGFIGSHIVDCLLKDNNHVIVYDNYSTGFRSFLEKHAGNKKLTSIEGDTLDLDYLKHSMSGSDFVFHFQANADVRRGPQNNFLDLEQNVLSTYNILESMRYTGVEALAFASSATLYGDADLLPTPEDAHKQQTSTYGASKLGCESYIEAFSEYYKFRSYIFRFVSFIGERYTHGVIYDFVKKLGRDPTQLYILGNGKQKKSFLDVEDGVSGILTGIKHGVGRVNIFNLGHTETINVSKVADIVCDELGLEGVAYRFSGGDRGWIGDSPVVHLDITRLAARGWSPRISIEDGIRKTVRYLLTYPELLSR